MTETAPPKAERIAKVLARAGIGSRRDIEHMIDEGRIWLRGKKLDTPATLVDSLDGITVDGEPVATPVETRLWRFHKRRGTLTTARDPEGRNTVFDKLPGHMGRVIAVGRLDMNTEGLLLLTNDGGLARWLELPETALARTYRVRVYGKVYADKVAALKDGATIDGVHYGPVQIEAAPQTAANTWLTVTIHEGKNREVRKLMAHLGLEVTRLIRTHYGPFALGKLALDDVARVPGAQLMQACSDYFNTTAGSSVSAPAKPANRKGWAKAKASDKPKPRKNRRPKSDGDLSTAKPIRKNRPDAGKISGVKSAAKTGQRPKSGKLTNDSRSTAAKGGHAKGDPSQDDRLKAARPSGGRHGARRPAHNKTSKGRATVGHSGGRQSGSGRSGGRRPRS